MGDVAGGEDKRLLRRDPDRHGLRGRDQEHAELARVPLVLRVGGMAHEGDAGRGVADPAGAVHPTGPRSVRLGHDAERSRRATLWYPTLRVVAKVPVGIAPFRIDHRPTVVRIDKVVHPEREVAVIILRHQRHRTRGRGKPGIQIDDVGTFGARDGVVAFFECHDVAVFPADLARLPRELQTDHDPLAPAPPRRSDLLDSRGSELEQIVRRVLRPVRVAAARIGKGQVAVEIDDPRVAVHLHLAVSAVDGHVMDETVLVRTRDFESPRRAHMVQFGFQAEMRRIVGRENQRSDRRTPVRNLEPPRLVGPGFLVRDGEHSVRRRGSGRRGGRGQATGRQPGGERHDLAEESPTTDPACRPRRSLGTGSHWLRSRERLSVAVARGIAGSCVHSVSLK